MEERIKQLELIVKRLMRRSRKHSIALITPYPISNSVFGEKVEGTVLRYMFPCEGRLTRGAIDFGKKPKQGISVTVSLMGDSGGRSKTFVLDRKREIVDMDIPVEPFDRLSIEISYTVAKPEDVLTEFWTSFLWLPTTREVEIKQMLNEEIENDILREEQVKE